jgi:hypothetical protein
VCEVGCVLKLNVEVCLKILAVTTHCFDNILFFLDWSNIGCPLSQAGSAIFSWQVFRGEMKEPVPLFLFILHGKPFPPVGMLNADKMERIETGSDFLPH